jgi:hypothetical protein
VAYTQFKNQNVHGVAKTSNGCHTDQFNDPADLCMLIALLPIIPCLASHVSLLILVAHLYYFNSNIGVVWYKSLSDKCFFRTDLDFFSP